MVGKNRDQNRWYELPPKQCEIICIVYALWYVGVYSLPSSQFKFRTNSFIDQDDIHRQHNISKRAPEHDITQEIIHVEVEDVPTAIHTTESYSQSIKYSFSYVKNRLSKLSWGYLLGLWAFYGTCNRTAARTLLESHKGSSHSSIRALLWETEAAEDFTGLGLFLCTDLPPDPDGNLTKHHAQFKISE